MSLDKATIIQSAQKFAIKGQIDKAIEEWQKLIQETPNDGNIYNTIGDLYLKKNSHSEAVSSYLKAGTAFNKAGFSLKTIAVYKKIIKIDPTNYDIYIKLADLDAERGLVGNAVEEYLKVVQYYSRNGLSKDSIPIYKKIISLDPDNITVKLKLADLCVKVGEKQNAIEQYIDIAKVYEKQNKSFEAEDILRKALVLQSDHPLASQLLTEFQSRSISSVKSSPIPDSGGHGESSSSLVKSDEENSQDLSELQEIEPPQHFNTGEKIENKDEKISTLLGEAEGYIRYRLYDKAEEILKKILEIEPDQAEALGFLKETAQFRGQTVGEVNSDLQIIDLQETGNDFSKSLDSPDNELLELSHEKSSLESIEFQTSQIGISSLDEEKIREKLAEGEFYTQQGLLGEAKIIYETILRYCPDHSLAKMKLNKVLSDLKELEEESGSELNSIPNEDLQVNSREGPSGTLQEIKPLSSLSEELSPISVETGKVRLKTTVLDKTENTDFVNLAGDLEEEFKEDGLPQPMEEILDDDFEKIIKEFRRGIQKSIGDTDFETHFNLGIAYKEMGLRTEAIGEFQFSINGENRAVDSAIMLAQCYLEEGLPKLAVEEILQVIHLPQLNKDQIHSLKYELAGLYELEKKFEEAINVLSEIYKENVYYRDVAKKISYLREKSSRRA